GLVRESLHLRESRGDVARDRVERAGAERVVRLALEQSPPRPAQRRLLVGRAEPPGERGPGLGPALEQRLAAPVGELDRHARRPYAGKEIRQPRADERAAHLRELGAV